MEIVKFIIIPAFLGGLGGLLDNAMKGEPILPCTARGLVCAWVLGVVSYLIFVIFHVSPG
jgi:hypothetical protein